MKAIIQGFRYDTDKAELIGEYSTPGSSSDFSHWHAGLYKTPRKGAYFLAGSGGPMTQFGRATGENQWSGGERIIPMSKEEAFAWAQEHLDPDDVDAEFADLIEEA